MSLRSTVRTRRSTAATSAGPATACPLASSPHWPKTPVHPGASSSTALTSRSTARQQVCCKKKGPRRIGRTKGGLNSKLHVVCDRHARPVVLLLSEGRMSDHKGAGLLIGALPPQRRTDPKQPYLDLDNPCRVQAGWFGTRAHRSFEPLCGSGYRASIWRSAPPRPQYPTHPMVPYLAAVGGGSAASAPGKHRHADTSGRTTVPCRVRMVQESQTAADPTQAARASRLVCGPLRGGGR